MTHLFSKTGLKVHILFILIPRKARVTYVITYILEAYPPCIYLKSLKSIRIRKTYVL
jgi:hypothetical protein